MRGKGVDAYRFYKNRRITPAYAGKSDNKVGEIAEWEDHPRLCGEKSILVMRAESPLGSPPPMRGKGFSAFEFYVDFGITPAYAGKSIHLTALSKCSWDHPRLCGEKTENRQTPAAQTGSPPPMRGKAATRQQRKVKKIGSPPPMRGKGKP